jgi:hypothetical protein
MEVICLVLATFWFDSCSITLPSFKKSGAYAPGLSTFKGQTAGLFLGFAPSACDLKSVDKTILGLIKTPVRKYISYFFIKEGCSFFL